MEEQTPTTKSLNERYTDLINELYRSFNFFNEYFCENKLNEPLITIQGDKRRGSTYGWFGKDFWSENGNTETKFSEINLTAESLYREPDQVLETLLHEMAHLKNAQNDISDCNTKTQFHNKKFKTTAEHFGLIVSQKKGKGWAITELGPKAILAIDLLKPNAEVYKITRTPPLKEKNVTNTITLMVSVDYQDKIDFLIDKFDKKRKMAEKAIDLLYEKEKSE